MRAKFRYKSTVFFVSQLLAISQHVPREKPSHVLCTNKQRNTVVAS